MRLFQDFLPLKKCVQREIHFPRMLVLNQSDEKAVTSRKWVNIQNFKKYIPIKLLSLCSLSRI